MLDRLDNNGREAMCEPISVTTAVGYGLTAAATAYSAYTMTQTPDMGSTDIPSIEATPELEASVSASDAAGAAERADTLTKQAQLQATKKTGSQGLMDQAFGYSPVVLGQ